MTVRKPLGGSLSPSSEILGGAFVGLAVGRGVGLGDGFPVGLDVCGNKLKLRPLVGKGVGFGIGLNVGWGVRFFFLLVPCFRLRSVGLLVGFGVVGVSLGECVGAFVGPSEGKCVGAMVGSLEGGVGLGNAKSSGGSKLHQSSYPNVSQRQRAVSVTFAA